MTDPDVTAHLDHLRDLFLTIPHCQEIGLRIEDLRPGFARMSLGYDEKLIGNPDTGHLHGAAITTLMDTVAGLTVMASVPNLTPIATLDLRIDYLKPATPGETVLGDTECYRITQNVAFVRGLAHHGDESDPIANVTASFMMGSVGFTGEAKAEAGA